MSILGGAMLSSMILFALSVFYFTYRTESEAWRGRQSEAARSAAGTVSSFIQRVEDALTIVSIVEPDHHVDDSDELQGLLDQNAALLEIIRTDSTGMVMANVNRDSSVLANLITIPQSQWFLQAKAGQTYIGNVQFSANNEPYLVMAVPNNTGGVVAARVQMGVLWEVVSNIHFGKSGQAYVITQTGQIIAHTNPEVVLDNTSIQDRPEFVALMEAPGNEWSGTFTNFEGRRVVGNARTIEGINWLVVTELPWTEAFLATRNSILVLGAVAFLLMLLASWSVAKYLRLLIVNPIEQLREGANIIGRGDLNHRIGLNRGDEIGQVALAFDAMAGSLQQRDAELEKQTKELLISEVRYRAIVEDQTELICRFLPDGTLTFVNEAYCRYFGKQRGDLIEHSFIPLIPDEDQPGVEAAFASLNVSNPVITYEHRVIMPDGSLRWQSWTDRAIFDEQGNIVEVASVGRDVTEREISKLALQKKTLQQEKLIEIAHKLTASLDLNAVLTQIAISAQDILDGYSCALYLLEPDGKTLRPVVAIDEKYQQEVTSTCIDIDSSFSGQAVKARHSLIFNDAADNNDGFQIPGTPENENEFIITVPLLLDEEVLGVMCVNRYDKKFDESDQTAAEVFATYASTALINSKAHNQLRIEIEERWKAEEALRQSENLYRLITENISDAVWIRDLNLRAVFISPSVTRLRGYSTEEAIAQTVEEICTPESAQTARLFFAQILCEALSASPDRLLNESRTLEMEMYRKDGSTIWTESVIKFILDANNQPAEIIGATRDISERKSAEEKLRKLNDELEERVRQRTIELSHVNLDLVNEVAERKHAEDIVRASLREKEILLKEIHHRVKNNLQIISSLLNLQSNQVADVRTLQALVDSRTRVRSMALIHEKLYQSQNLTNIDFAEYVKSLSSDLFRSYSRNLTGIRLDVQADEVTLDIDHAISCGLILNELMTNALKYAFPDGKSGTIWVELRTTPEHFLSLRVADNGVGIPSGFDALNSKSLGLQLVKTLSGQLGGTMELEQSEGTAFRISFRY